MTRKLILRKTVSSSERPGELSMTAAPASERVRFIACLPVWYDTHYLGAGLLELSIGRQSGSAYTRGPYCARACSPGRSSMTISPYSARTRPAFLKRFIALLHVWRDTAARFASSSCEMRKWLVPLAFDSG